MIHIADWYTTFCGLNGLNCSDNKAINAGLPNIDGYNMWDLISGINNTSPRTQIVINENVLIENEYKLIINTTLDYAGWANVIYPNSSSVVNAISKVKLDCNKGCLFDVVNDMTEHVDIIDNNSNIAESMDQTLNQLIKSFYSNNENGVSMCPSNINISCPCWVAQNKYNGFYGPYQQLTDYA